MIIKALFILWCAMFCTRLRGESRFLRSPFGRDGPGWP